MIALAENKIVAATVRCEWFDPPPGEKPVVLNAEIKRMLGAYFTRNSNGEEVPASSRVSGENLGIGG